MKESPALVVWFWRAAFVLAEWSGPVFSSTAGAKIGSTGFQRVQSVTDAFTSLELIAAAVGGCYDSSTEPPSDARRLVPVRSGFRQGS